MKAAFVVVSLLTILAAILLFEAKEDSGTYDEVAHITAGYTYLYKHDFRLYPDNPPLVKMISVLPWFPLRNIIRFPDNSPLWKDTNHIDQWGLGKQFLYQSGNDADKLIFMARLPIIVITLLLGLLVFTISSSLYGKNAGLLALALFVSSPDIRAHGHLGTTDVGATFFALLAVFLFWKSLKYLDANSLHPDNQKAKRNHFLLYFFSAAIFFSFALLSKYSMWFMAASLLIFTSGSFLASFFLKNNPNLKSKMQKIGALGIGLIVISYGFIWIFSVAIGSTHQTFSYDSVALNQSAANLFGSKIGWKAINLIPFPYYYRTGIETMYARNIITQPTFLFGNVIPKGGLKLFFPIAYVLKTPIPILVIFGIALYLMTRKFSFSKSLPLLFSCTFFMFIIGIGNLSIGTRFFYPFTVLALIFASSAFSFLARKKFIAAGLFIYLILTNALSFPFDISYVNELGGGTGKGYSSLVDSSFDWGQDLKRLASWYVIKNSGKPILLSYLGTADPSYYGIKYTQATYQNIATFSGKLAISVTNLKLAGVYRENSFGETIYDPSPLNRLFKATPIEKIGTTILIYDL